MDLKETIQMRTSKHDKSIHSSTPSLIYLFISQIFIEFPVVFAWDISGTETILPVFVGMFQDTVCGYWKFKITLNNHQWGTKVVCNHTMKPCNSNCVPTKQIPETPGNHNRLYTLILDLLLHQFSERLSLMQAYY